jgi:hypothetical protein
MEGRHPRVSRANRGVLSAVIAAALLPAVVRGQPHTQAESRRYLSAGIAAVYAHRTWDLPDAAAAAPHAALGLVRNDRYVFEIEFSKPTSITHVEEGAFSLPREGGPSGQASSQIVTSRRVYRQTVPYSISLLLGRRLPPWGAARVTLSGGLSSQARKDATTVELPDLSTSGPSGLRVQRSERTRYVGALTGGADLAVTVTRRIEIVPQMRVTWWGLQGVTLRSGVSARWTF